MSSRITICHQEDQHNLILFTVCQEVPMETFNMFTDIIKSGPSLWTESFILNLEDMSIEPKYNNIATLFNRKFFNLSNPTIEEVIEALGAIL